MTYVALLYSYPASPALIRRSARIDCSSLKSGSTQRFFGGALALLEVGRGASGDDGRIGRDDRDGLSMRKSHPNSKVT